jgi:acyl carrier protein
MSEDINDWVIKWFQKNTPMEEGELRDLRRKNYLESAWIDSLTFISLISDIENHFKIRFSNDEFQDRSFATIEGMVKIIKEHM